MTQTVAIVGTGTPSSANGYAMAYRHAEGYRRLDSCSLIACADIREENARAFAETFDIDPALVYTDHRELLEDVAPDLVSVCTPPRTHADIVVDCAVSGAVTAVHCEKPMAATWDACRRMASVCDREDVQLTINHQRRFAAPYRNAKEIVEEGRIGELERLEVGGKDLFDYGTHLFDLCGYVTDQTPIDWVLAAVDTRAPRVVYETYHERQALAHWQYSSGVSGLASTGEEGFVPCELRLVGDDGTIEIGHRDGPPLRLRRNGGDWRRLETGRDGVWRSQPYPVDAVLDRLPFGEGTGLSEPTYVERAIEEVVECARTGGTSTLDARNALQTTELIFACYESARRNERVSLPLEIRGHPINDLVSESGLEPAQSAASRD